MKVVQKNGVESEEKNVFGQIWFKYMPYWPLFLVLLTIAIAGAWLYIRYKTNPFYEATASILIKDEKKGQDEAKMIETLNQLSAKKIIENEIEGWPTTSPHREVLQVRQQRRHPRRSTRSPVRNSRWRDAWSP